MDLVVLKASVASMTSKDMITSLALMTSTASLVSKSQKLLAGWIPCHQEPQQPQWPQQPEWPQWPQWPQKPQIVKILTEHDFANNLAIKWPILVSQCGMDHQKPAILWIFGTLSTGGCGGHGCYFQPNPRVISQMSTSHKCADTVFMT